jgi:hypothetical protein
MASVKSDCYGNVLWVWLEDGGECGASPNEKARMSGRGDSESPSVFGAKETSCGPLESLT